MPRTVLLQACVGPAEEAVLRQAAAMIEESLDGAVSLDVAILDCVETVDPSPTPRLLVTSLLADAENADRPWDVCERRIRARYAALARDPRLTVYICTIFRHVAARSPGGDRALVHRIRRLDLLAADLSREMGIFVVDLDRALADVGGATLETDWRLGGPHAAEAAAACLAGVVLATGLEDVVDAAALDAAAKALARRVAASPARSMRSPAALGGGGVAVRAGAGRQTAHLLTAHGGADAYLRAAIAGTLPLGQAFETVMRAIARRGLAEAAGLVLGAARSLLTRRRAQSVR
jgi:hypothetical protein